MGPKEDPNARRDRERERRMSTIERRNAAQEGAAGLTNDVRNVYGLGGLSMFNMAKSKPKSTTATNLTLGSLG